MDKNSSNERCNITALSNTLQNIMKYADETARQFFGEDIVDVAACSTEILSDSFKLLQALKKVASIPTKLYMRKFDRYCRGLTQIPLSSEAQPISDRHSAKQRLRKNTLSFIFTFYTFFSL